MPDYVTTVLAEPSLVAYFRMNETSGSTLVDSKGGYSGIYVGGYTLNRAGFGFNGPSVYFDGNTGRAESSPLLYPLYNGMPQNYAIEAWVKFDGPANDPYPGVIAGVSGTILNLANKGLYQTDTGLFLQTVAVNPVRDELWHHLVEAYDGSAYRSYRDGVLLSSFPDAPPQPSGSRLQGFPFVIGGYGPDSNPLGIPLDPFFAPNAMFLRGYISNVAYYSSALDAGKVRTHYLASAIAPINTWDVQAQAAVTFSSTATAVRLAAHVGKVSVTQVVVEAARLQLDGFVHVTQVVVEVLLPFVAGGTGTFAVDAAASVVFHASAVGHRAFRVTAGPTSVVFTATGNGFHGLYKKAAATVVFTATAVLNNSARGATAHCTVVFRCRAKNKFRPIVFGDDYLGRFQLGQEVPLWDLVRDQHGTPALPTAVPPVAEVYNLDTRVHVEGVEMTRLRGARTDSVYVKPLRLSAIYTLGRHAVVYRAVTGGFVGYNVAIFEVVPGGDPSGPAFASHTLAAPAGDQVVAQLGSGALAKGSRPRVS